MGFDSLPERLGAGRLPTGGQSPSRIAGQLVLVLIMLFASIEVLNTLGFVALAAIVTGLLSLLGRVALGLIIFGLGFYLARPAAHAVCSSGLANAPMLALVAQGAVLALADAMALQQRGYATHRCNCGPRGERKSSGTVASLARTRCGLSTFPRGNVFWDLAV